MNHEAPPIVAGIVLGIVIALFLLGIGFSIGVMFN